MTFSAFSRTCPQCGKPLPAAAAGQPCPVCLMAQALASGTAFATGGPNAAGEKAGVRPVPTPEEIAANFPQFEILGCLGRGGMGVVYKARQKSLNRVVAIKVLAPEREHDARFAERFAREAELLAKLSHPHIVTIHDFGREDGLFYIVMEFVDGVNLRDLLREGKIEPRQALAIVPPVCEALQYAHDRGVVHRDIKPENLLLDREGRVKIADFGIAALVGGEGAGGVGERAGTPPYMAPEQGAKKADAGGASAAFDHRADIYALGVVLYEMLTGERPGREVVAPSRKVRIDVRLDEIVLRALEKQPELRYATATEFKTSVETIVATSPASPAAAAPPRPRSRLRTAALVLVGFASAFLLLGLVIAGLWMRSRHEEGTAERVAMAQAERVRNFGPTVPFTPPATPVFGPEIPVELPLHPAGYSDAFDFDTERIAPAPEMPTPWEWRTHLLPWGVIVIPATDAHPTMLAGTSIRVWPMQAGEEYWSGRMALSNATAGAVTVTLGETSNANGEGKLPQTFAFQTAGGRRGLLRVQAVPDNPRRVQLRYKLVQTAGSQGDASGFIRQSGDHPFAVGGKLTVTASGDVRVSFSPSRETFAVPGFIKGKDGFVYIESAERVWIFDGARQLDVICPGGRYSAGDLGVGALCPAIVWEAVPEAVRKFYREQRNSPGDHASGEPAPGAPALVALFHDYAVHQTLAQLAAASATPTTPEEIAGASVIALIDGDAAAAKRVYELDSPPLPDGAVHLNLPASDKAAIRRQEVLRVIVYREDLAAVIFRRAYHLAPQPPRHIAGLVLGRRDGRWGVFSSASDRLADEETEEKIVAAFRAAAPEFFEALQKLPATRPEAPKPGASVSTGASGLPDIGVSIQVDPQAGATLTVSPATAAQTSDLERARTLLMSAFMFASAHEGRWPATLGELDGLLAGTVYDPANKAAPRPEAEFVYVAPPASVLSDGKAAKTVVLTSRVSRPERDGRRVFGFADGHVELRPTSGGFFILPSSAEATPPAAPTTLSVELTGPVARPGRQTLPAPATVLDALAAAGGWKGEDEEDMLVFVVDPHEPRPEKASRFFALDALLSGHLPLTPLDDGARIFLLRKSDRFDPSAFSTR